MMSEQLTSTVRGKVDQCKILRKLLESKKAELEKHQSTCRRLESDLEVIQSNYDDECRKLTEMGVSVADVMSTSLDTSDSDTNMRTDQENEPDESNSLVMMILGAAQRAKTLQKHNEMLQVMYDEGKSKVKNLTEQLDESMEKEKKLEEQIQKLQYDVNRLRDVGGIASDDRVLTADPRLLAEKIRQLEHRVSAMSENQRMEDVCTSLKKQIEETKSRLEQIMIGSGLDQSNTSSTTTTPCHCQWAVTIVEDLEDRICGLEKQLREHDNIKKTVDRQTSACFTDERAAFECQIDEYKDKLSQTENELSREKSQNKSLEIQWTTLYNELQKAIKEKEKVEETNNSLKSLLQQANVEQERIEACLKSSTRMDLPGIHQESSSDSHRRKSKQYKKSRGTLEEDSAGRRKVRNYYK